MAGGRWDGAVHAESYLSGAGGEGCDDANDCTDDACDVTTGCTHVENTASCDDGDACTEGDMCAAGVCAPGPIATSCVDAGPPDGGETDGGAIETVLGDRRRHATRIRHAAGRDGIGRLSSPSSCRWRRRCRAGEMLPSRTWRTRS